ncbi:hypothetical protein, partial [Staphylococcus epidermidis]|uniref:hypothetical protein n=1 Tax=Staphylococcus epidermidis TaxID=1282 RepID=UPI001643575F
ENKMEEVGSRDGMSEECVGNYNQKLEIAKKEINRTNKVLGKNVDVNGMKRNKGEGEGMSKDLREGKNKLEVDIESLEKIKRQLEDE